MKSSIRETENVHGHETISSCLQRARKVLNRVDADVLTSKALNVSHSFLHAYPEHFVTSSSYLKLQHWIDRRQSGEPVAHILGEKEFWSLTLKTPPGVFIPRPETELLVERALTYINENTRVLDLGTGCGAVALAIRSEIDTSVTATDIESTALATCQSNIRTLSLPIKVVQSDWYASLDDAFEVIVSNPPYVERSHPYLSSGDVRFEPCKALVGGDDGLSGLRAIIHTAPKFLNEYGNLIVEHGYNQAEPVRQLFLDAHFVDVTTSTDLGGIPRVTEGMKR